MPQNAYLEILDKIIENTETFGVLTVLDIDEGANFCSLV